MNHGAAVHIGLGEKAGARTKIHQVGFVSVRLRKKIKDWKKINLLNWKVKVNFERTFQATQELGCLFRSVDFVNFFE